MSLVQGWRKPAVPRSVTSELMFQDFCSSSSATALSYLGYLLIILRARGKFENLKRFPLTKRHTYSVERFRGQQIISDNRIHSLKDFVYFIFTEGKGGRKRGRDTSISCLLYEGPNPQPRHVSWPRMEPVTFCFVGWCPTTWVTPVRATESIFLKAKVARGTREPFRSVEVDLGSLVSVTPIVNKHFLSSLSCTDRKVLLIWRAVRTLQSNHDHKIRL